MAKGISLDFDEEGAVTNLSLPRRGAWSTFYLVVALVAGLTMLAVLCAPPDLVTRLQVAIRTTARTSAALFLAAFTASALAAYRPGAVTDWVLRHRRQLGLGFAFSHAIHALLIYCYVRVAPEAFWDGRSVATNVPGTIGYVAILLLVLTSSDTAVARLGPATWKRLHTSAMWVIFAVFFIAFAKRIPVNVAYAAPTLVFAVAAALRLARRPRPTRVA